LVQDRPRLKVVQTGITREVLGVCVRKGDSALRQAIDAAQAALVKDGTLAALIRQWLGEGATAPS
jgi:ABC-type amino acid transport substrate-binding protein